jgi:HSP20 family protein
MKYLTRRNNYDVFDIFDRMLQPMVRTPYMSTDISETDKAYLFSIDMPGFNKEDISITVEDGYLSVSANKSEVKEDNNNGYIYRERRTGSCSRNFYIGAVNEDSITAKYENGILNITVPKSDKADNVKRIKIN